jgi:hypothetical protein
MMNSYLSIDSFKNGVTVRIMHILINVEFYLNKSFKRAIYENTNLAMQIKTIFGKNLPHKAISIQL